MGLFGVLMRSNVISRASLLDLTLEKNQRLQCNADLCKTLQVAEAVSHVRNLQSRNYHLEPVSGGPTLIGLFQQDWVASCVRHVTHGSL